VVGDTWWESLLGSIFGWIHASTPRATSDGEPNSTETITAIGFNED
jgi:hypothetical protein